ncbi:MAG: TRAP transporter small permease [Thermodesulfobacteriota bacterium]
MLDRLSRNLDRISCYFMVTALAVMVAVVFAQVIWRYVFQASIFWSEELSRYLMVWATMFAAGVCLRRGAHMAVRFVHDLFPARLRQATSLIVYAAILVFLAVVFWYGLDLMRRTWDQISPTLFLRMGLVYAAIPLGALLMAVHDLALLQKIWRHGGLDAAVSEAEVEKEA